VTAGGSHGVGFSGADDALTAAVRSLVGAAGERALDERSRSQLAEASARLNQPLRLAIAGRVKAGKSTLLNALVGEELAPTDAGECTKIVTWYLGADVPQVSVHGLDGSVRIRPYSRAGGALDVDLGAPAEEVDHLEVRWPSSRLRDVTLIDTPGIASLSTDVSARASAVLSDDD
jgi:GTPase SAR1 family protein